MQRRTFLAPAAPAAFQIQRSAAEWISRLSPDEFAVMRDEGTEQPYSSPLLDETRPGTFHCKGCDLPLYDAATKFKSGTGWPSFYQALDGAIGTKDDRKLLVIVRTEVHCRRCGSHLGHIFDDGPPPTGKRHCLNGIALTFQPA